MRFGSLFAGIGGLDLGLERAGMECAWQVEIDDYCRRVLTKHWPNVPKFGDVRECGATNLEPVDLICGGFPCQPFSVAGKRRGVEDDRHLWPEMLRIIDELRPTFVLGENVPGLIPMALDQVLDDLEAIGYEARAITFPAARVWVPGTDETDFGLLATMKGGPRKTVTSLQVMAKMFPTPSATDYKGSGKAGTLRDRLDYAAERQATKSHFYPTPHANCHTGTGEHGMGGQNLQTQIGGSLNPTWVEWFMGFPEGWTDLEHSETQSSPNVPNSSEG